VSRQKAVVVRSRLIARVALTRSISHIPSLSCHSGPTASSILHTFMRQITLHWGEKKREYI